MLLFKQILYRPYLEVHNRQDYSNNTIKVSIAFFTVMIESVVIAYNKDKHWDGHLKKMGYGIFHLNRDVKEKSHRNHPQKIQGVECDYSVRTWKNRIFSEQRHAEHKPRNKNECANQRRMASTFQCIVLSMHKYGSSDAKDN